MHHVLEKGFQAGSVVGVAAVVPFVAWRLRRTSGFSQGGSAEGLLRALGKSAVWGTGITALLGAARIATTEDLAGGLQDRAYRLHYNKGQRRTDLFSEIGMALGGTAAMFVSPAAAVVLGGAAAGSALGVLAHVATSPRGSGEA
jgi:hypothetical protein